jgi:hypothetical protein
MIVLSIPKRPDASPERKAVAASTHSSAVTSTPFGWRDRTLTARSTRLD